MEKINLNGSATNFIKNKYTTPLPFTINPLNKLTFEDAPTDYILLCKVAEKNNDVIDVTNTLQDAMEAFFKWVGENLYNWAQDTMTGWLEQGIIKVDLKYTEETEALEMVFTKEG